MRRLLALTALIGFALAVASFVRRGAGRRRERVDLYYDDGSMVSLVDGMPDAERLLPVARRIIGTARGVR